MKFVHIADMHFDTPFVLLSNKSDLGDIRRQDQKIVFKKIVEYIKENKIEYFFISGDLYDNEHIKYSTIEFINNLFRQIPETKIYITPGNHDPYLKNSYYTKYQWAENVKIFSGEISKISDEKVDIYGCGFEDFYYSNSEIEKIKIENKEKINILITHGTLNGSTAMERDYNPLSKKELEKIGFDYIALGHIHKPDYNSEINQKIIYPGSTVSLGFDELGKHGIIVGTIEENKNNNQKENSKQIQGENNNFKIEFIPFDNREFKIIKIDVTDMFEINDIINDINKIEENEEILYKVELIGRRKFEININLLNKLITNNSIIKIKDLTKMGYDIEKIAGENTLKGLFAKEILNAMKEEIISKEDLENIFEIGYEVLEK